MFRALITASLACALMLSPSAFAQTTNKENSVEKLPVEYFFKNAAYEHVVISPTGKYFAIKSNAGDRDQILVFNRETSKVASSFNLAENQRFSDILWVTDERFIFASQKYVGLWDNQGGPRNLYAANADGSNRLQLFFSDTAGYLLLSLLPNDPEHILIGRYHWRDGGEVKVHRLNVNNARTFYEADQPPKANGVRPDNKGNLRMGYIIEPDDDDVFKSHITLFYKPFGKDNWVEYEIENFREGATVLLNGYSDDGRYAYLSTNNWDATTQVYRFDTQLATLEKIAGNDLVDVYTTVTGMSGELLGVEFMPGKIERVYFENDTKSAKLLKQLEQAFPGQRVHFTSTTKDKKQAIISVSSDRNAGEFYLLNTETLQVSFIAAPRENLYAEDMAPMQPISYTTRDDITIHGYLTTPRDWDGKTKLPMIVKVHGGPHGPRDTWEFNSEVQFFANRGYAILQVNFRGSGGYGYGFQQSGYQKWGREMQDDVTDGTLWAIEQGIADEDRICIYGGSYGGYAALMGVIREPDLYQCSVGYVGIYSLPLMYEVGDVQETSRGKKVQERFIGTDEQVLKANSPVYNVDKIKVPLYLVHGSRDVRVPIDHMHALTKALDSAGKDDYKVFVREDGHGFYKEEYKLELYKELESFFAEHLSK